MWDASSLLVAKRRECMRSASSWLIATTLRALRRESQMPVLSCVSLYCAYMTVLRIEPRYNDQTTWQVVIQWLSHISTKHDIIRSFLIKVIPYETYSPKPTNELMQLLWHIILTINFHYEKLLLHKFFLGQLCASWITCFKKALLKFSHANTKNRSTIVRIGGLLHEKIFVQTQTGGLATTQSSEEK